MVRQTLTRTKPTMRNYSKERHKYYLKYQKENNNITYVPEFSINVENGKKSIKNLITKYKNSDYEKFVYYTNYLDRVKKLFDIIPKFPRRDKDRNFDSFTYKGFDVPEVTHRKTILGNKTKGYEIWSKDIDKENRLIYGICEINDKKGIILFLSILGHDLKEDTKSYSENPPYFTTLMRQVIITRNLKEGNVSNQLKKLIDSAKKYGLVDTDEYLIIYDEDGIDVYDKSTDEVTHVVEEDDGSTTYSKGK